MPKAPPGTVVLFPTGEMLPVGAEHRRIIVEWDRAPTQEEIGQFARHLYQIILETEEARRLAAGPLGVAN